MKKIICTVIILALSVAAFTACKKEEPINTTTALETTAQTTKTTTQTTTETTTQTTTEKETEKKEKPFEEWNEKDLSKYFKKEKVFTNDEYLGVYSNVEELPDGVSGEIEYNSHDDSESISVLIFYFDKDSSDKKTKELGMITANSRLTCL